MIEIKRWDTDEVIHSGEFESVCECLKDGVRKGIDFSNANLNGENLAGAILDGAKLAGAELNYTNLTGSTFVGADLFGADLYGAEIRGICLVGADITRAKFNGCTGATDRVFCMQHGKYHLVIVDDICHGGCTTKTVQQWLDYDGDGLGEYDKSYLETFTKPFIRMVMAYRKGE